MLLTPRFQNVCQFKKNFHTPKLHRHLKKISDISPEANPLAFLAAVLPMETAVPLPNSLENSLTNIKLYPDGILKEEMLKNMKPTPLCHAVKECFNFFY